MTASSGRPSGCSPSSVVTSDRDSAAAILPPHRFRAADEGTLAYPVTMRSRPVVHLGAGVDLDCRSWMVADVGPCLAATRPGGLGARAAERGSGQEQQDDRTPALHHVSWSEEKMMTARRISPPRRTSTGPIARRGLRPRNRVYKGSAIPPSTITARRRPQPFSHTVAIGPSETISAAIATASRTRTEASKRSSASLLSSDAPPQEPSRIKSAADVDAAEIKKVSPRRVVSAQIGRLVTARRTPA